MSLSLSFIAMHKQDWLLPEKGSEAYCKCVIHKAGLLLSEGGSASFLLTSHERLAFAVTENRANTEERSADPH